MIMYMIVGKADVGGWRIKYAHVKTPLKIRIAGENMNTPSRKYFKLKI